MTTQAEAARVDERRRDAQAQVTDALVDREDLYGGRSGGRRPPVNFGRLSWCAPEATWVCSRRKCDGGEVFSSRRRESAPRSADGDTKRVERVVRKQEHVVGDVELLFRD
jgi:hypothetical protein